MLKGKIPDNLWSVSITIIPRKKDWETVRYYRVEAGNHQDAINKCLQQIDKLNKYDRVKIIAQPFPAIPELKEFEIFPVERANKK
jgi:tRNA splicing ligase